MTIERIAVLGTGANGAAIAADFTRAGLDVTLIDQWPENVQAMRADGVSVDCGGLVTTTPVRAFHLSDVATMRSSFDLVVVAMKAYDTRWSCELIRPLLSENSLVVGLQNGMTVDDMSDVVGVDRTVGAVIEVAANMFVPGHVQQQAPMWFALGAPEGGPQERIDELFAIFSNAGTATISDDILSSKWMKLVANASELVTSAIMNLPLADAIEIPGVYDLMLSAGEEAARTAVDAGFLIVPVFGMTDVGDLTPEQYANRLLDTVLTSYTLPDTRSAVLQDWIKGRRAEINEINGHVVKTRARLGGVAPVNQTILDVALRIEAGELEASPALATLMIQG